MSDGIVDAEDFLEVVYGEREGWIDLPAKVSSYWVPFYTNWPNEGAVTRRIDSSLRDREDLYYSVAQFSERGRAIQHVLPSLWLWADLDEVHPTEGARIGLQPTIAIESSPHRYQALWRLTRPLSARDLEKVNRGLSYALGADRGGWDLTQVLRIPGTRNHKYPGSPLVSLLWYNEALVYKPSYVWRIVRDAVPQGELKIALGAIERQGLPARARRLLRAEVSEVVEGERSARLWELECLLAESGMDEGEIYELVHVSVWHKWRGRGAQGEARLRSDIRKAMRWVRRAGESKERGERGEDKGNEVDEGAGLPFVRYGSFMSMVMEEPKWLVRDVWTAGSHGIIGGEPKTQKTTLALALAMAVASGRDFLGEYPVGDPGPVLMVQEENAPWLMQDRMRKLGAFMGLLDSSGVRSVDASAGALGKRVLEVDFGRDLPLKLLNNFGFDLAVDDHRGMLEAEVEAWRPKLVILDPLYLILGGANENAGAELRPFLKWLLHLRYKYNCAIAVVHHMRKQQQGGAVVRAGQRLMGNATLHGWVDSALYTSVVGSGDSVGGGNGGVTKTRVEREFRSMAPAEPIELSIGMDLPGSLGMTIDVGRYDLTGLIRNIVEYEGEGGITVVQIAEQLGIDKRTVYKRVTGSEVFHVQTGARGKGKSHRVFMTTEDRRNGDKETDLDA